jgi:hypothetical protein
MQAIEQLGYFQLPGIVYNPCDMGPCIIMLKHELKTSNQWYDNGPQNLIAVSLCIQIAVDKMHLCLFSIVYACPYHNTTTLTSTNCTPTQSHTIQLLDMPGLGLRVRVHHLTLTCQVVDYLGKGEMLTDGEVNTFVPRI